MSGQLKEVRLRIQSVQNTQQITKAMKMVSAAKLRKAQDTILSIRHASEKLSETFANVLQSANDIQNALTEVRKIQKTLLLVVAADRGLCGAYNANIIKLAKSYITEQCQEQEVEVWTIGKKAYDGMVRHNQTYNVDNQFSGIYHKANYEAVHECAQSAVRLFTEKKIDKVILVYSRFKNAATQLPIIEDFLPIILPTKITATAHNLYLFQPSEKQIVDTLTPLMLNMRLLNAIRNGIASEHGARMTAMDKASENASDLIRSLRLMYNSARQAKITTELNEIVSGANALNG